MRKRNKVRIAAVIYIAVAVAVLVISITRGWFGAEKREIRGPIEWAWRTRLYPCGFVRGILPWDAVDQVPCQVWNLAPLNIVALFAARWLLVDMFRLLR